MGLVNRPSTQRRLRGANVHERRAQLGSRVAVRRTSVAPGAPESAPDGVGAPRPGGGFDASRLRAPESAAPYVRPARRHAALRVSTVLVWGGGALVLFGVLLIAAVGVERWFGPAADPSAVARTPVPSLPELAVAGPVGSAAHAQQLVRVRAEAFAACVHRAGGVDGTRPADLTGASTGPTTTAPPYGRCDSARAIGIAPSAITRRGKHGPIDGRGARSGLGLFTVHGEREAWLLQYDAAGRGWGYSFAADGTVEVQCRTPKGRLCWHLEDEPAGALFLGDHATVAFLAAVLQVGRAAG